MSVLYKILIILLLIALVVSLFAVLQDKEPVSFGSLIQSFENSAKFDTSWVSKIQINVSLPDNTFLQGIIDFINNVLLAPIRAILILGTFIVNVVVYVYDYLIIYYVQ